MQVATAPRTDTATPSLEPTRPCANPSRDAQHTRGRAEAASHTTDGRYNPVTVASRIETLGAEARKLERRNIVDRYDSERGYVRPTAEQVELTRASLAPYIAEKRDQIAYWEGVRAAQIESGRATGFSRETVKKGDRVKVRGC